MSPLKPQGTHDHPAGTEGSVAHSAFFPTSLSRGRGVELPKADWQGQSLGSPLALLVESVSVVFDGIKLLLVKAFLSCKTNPLVVLRLERTGLLEGSFLCAH